MHPDHAGIGGIIGLRKCCGNDCDLRLLNEQQFVRRQYEWKEWCGVVQDVDRFFGSGLEAGKCLEEDVTLEPESGGEGERDAMPHFLNSIVTHSAISVGKRSRN